MRCVNDRAVQHARGVEVGHVGAIAQRRLEALVARKRCADAAGLEELGNFFATTRACVELDRVDHLYVAGAAAEVAIERDGDLRPGGLRRAIDQVFRLERDARNTEAALNARRVHEGVREQVALVLLHALERDDLLPVTFLGGDRARRLRLTIDDRQAAAALALWRATVLQRADAAALTQRLEQRLSGRDVELLRDAVDGQVDGRHVRQRIRFTSVDPRSLCGGLFALISERLARSGAKAHAQPLT